MFTTGRAAHETRSRVHDRQTQLRPSRESGQARAKKYEIWDDVISGLGLSVRPTGVRTYFLRRMVRRHGHYATTGNADAVTLPEAWREARKLVANYFDTTRKDNGPKTPGRAMDALAAEFLERHAWH